MLDHPFGDDDNMTTVETTATATPSAKPKVEVPLSGGSALVKELPPLTFDDIKAKELTYIGGNAPIENRKMFDSILADYMAKRVVQTADSWYKIGEALSYMVESDIHVTLGYSSIEDWLKNSLEKILVEVYDCDKGVEALLQYRNYYDLERRIEDCSVEAVKNWREVLPGVSDYRKLNSMISNPKTFLPGVEISVDSEMKETLTSIMAETIATILLEQPEPKEEAMTAEGVVTGDSKGKDYRKELKSARRTTLNKMFQVGAAVIATEIAESVDHEMIKENHFYEMLGEYTFWVEEPAKGNKEGETLTELKKISYNFKPDPWVEVMSYDPDNHTVTIRPWGYFSLTQEERAKKHMNEQGILHKEVSICSLNLKDPSKAGLTLEDLENQEMEYEIRPLISRGTVKTLIKAYRNEDPSALGDVTGNFLEEHAVELECDMQKRSAEKKKELLDNGEE